MSPERRSKSGTGGSIKYSHPPLPICHDLVATSSGHELQAQVLGCVDNPVKPYVGKINMPRGKELSSLLKLAELADESIIALFILTFPVSFLVLKVLT